MPRRTLVVAALLGALLATTSGGPLPGPARAARPDAAQVAPLSPPATVRVGVQGSAANAPIYIGYERGYFRQEGLNVELVLLPSANELIPALAAGHIEVASGGIAAGLFNAIARGIDVRMVSADSASMPPGERGSAGSCARTCSTAARSECRGPARPNDRHGRGRVDLRHRAGRAAGPGRPDARRRAA